MMPQNSSTKASDLLVLGIESTCDETAAAVVRNGEEILSNVISSQSDLHAVYGGVVPELACRRHIDLFIPVLDEALATAKLSLHDIDLLATAYGPGLIGALFIGLEGTKALSLALNKPFVAVNHIEAHLYAAIMSVKEPIAYPALGVVLSGGHTSLLIIHGIGEYTLIAETVDDAVGEAFDKVAKMLGLSYPGGPLIEERAKKGDRKRFSFHAGQVKGKPLHFSFSGLKTAVLYAKQKLSPPYPIDDIAASFQEAAVKDIVSKVILAAEKYRLETLIFGGGVTQNQYLRQFFAEHAPHLRQVWPAPKLSLDNGAMIAGLGYHQYCLQGKGDSLSLAAKTRIFL